MTRESTLQAAPRLVRQLDPQFAALGRDFQGIPTIERAANGRLWAAWYGMTPNELPGNCVMVATSGDGLRWTEPVLFVQPPDLEHRAYDSCLWCDPLDRLWLFWAQSKGTYDGVAGVWASVCDDPTRAEPQFSTPFRIADGVMMNKPTVLRDGTWLLPIGHWSLKATPEQIVADKRYSYVYASHDGGQSFRQLGWADVPQRSFDEHMVIEKRDGSLWMLVRTTYGVGQSFSRDGGRTWSPGQPSAIQGPCSRFFIRRLRSGRLLLITHEVNPEKPRQREKLTAYLSDDDGQTWPTSLLLDERVGVSYPDGVEDPQGRIYAIYDHNRGNSPLGREREILLAVFTEDDVLAGRCVGTESRLRCLVNRVVDL